MPAFEAFAADRRRPWSPPSTRRAPRPTEATVAAALGGRRRGAGQLAGDRGDVDRPGDGAALGRRSSTGRSTSPGSTSSSTGEPASSTPEVVAAQRRRRQPGPPRRCAACSPATTPSSCSATPAGAPTSTSVAAAVADEADAVVADWTAVVRRRPPFAEVVADADAGAGVAVDVRQRRHQPGPPVRPTSRRRGRRPGPPIRLADRAAQLAGVGRGDRRRSARCSATSSPRASTASSTRRSAALRAPATSRTAQALADEVDQIADHRRRRPPRRHGRVLRCRRRRLRLTSSPGAGAGSSTGSARRRGGRCPSASSAVHRILLGVLVRVQRGALPRARVGRGALPRARAPPDLRLVPVGAAAARRC